MAEQELRQAGLEDAEAALALSRAAYAHWAEAIGREPLPMKADYRQAVVDHRIDFLEEAGALIALIETVAEDDSLLIINIAVQPNRQGEGVGDRLLRHADRLAVDLGLVELRLYTNAKFASNLAFYGKRGFVEFKRETLAPGSVAVHMRRPVGAAALTPGP